MIPPPANWLRSIRNGVKVTTVPSRRTYADHSLRSEVSRLLDYGAATCGMSEVEPWSA